MIQFILITLFNFIFSVNVLDCKFYQLSMTIHELIKDSFLKFLADQTYFSDTVKLIFVLLTCVYLS